MRWANWGKTGFTIVELLLIVLVIGILVAITVVAYNGVQKNAAEKAVQSDLDNVSTEMQRAQLANGGLYPATLPTTIKPSPHVTLTLKYSGTTPFYGAGAGLSAVQNGVLLSQICQDLINEGYGKGKNQAGTVKDFITGCGNWNHNSMQITGWDSEVYSTPVSDVTLLNYADNFTTTDTYNKAQETVIKTFYHALVDRQTKEGGSFPITSFWDSWASPTNGGVVTQPLPPAQQRPGYCVEAVHDTFTTIVWHVTEGLKLESGGC